MKKLLISATVAASILALTACNGEEDTQQSAQSEVIVETTAGNITKDEFYEALKDRFGDVMLRELVVTKVLSEEYEVKDSEIENKIAALKQQYGENYLQQYGFTEEEELRKAIRSSLLEEKAATANVEVTDEDVEFFYEKLSYEVQASHILLRDEETANKVHEKLEAGADFAELAKEHSVDPTANNGGDLGWFSAGRMVTEFEDAAYTLEVGEVSEPIQTQFGWHIIKVTDKREIENKALKPFEEVKEQIRDALKRQQANKDAVQEEINEANVDIKIEEFKDLFKTEEDKQ